MIITCACGEKKFSLPDGAIPASGRMVQCGFCDKTWKQFPIGVKDPKEVRLEDPAPIKSAPPVNKVRKVKKKASGPAPYSKEYMEQKWGSEVKNYAQQKGISKKKAETKKVKKTKSTKLNEKRVKPGFGFFNYIITYSIGFTFLVGILNFERTRLVRKFPFLEPYIDSFFESLEIFKAFILDYYR